MHTAENFQKDGAFDHEALLDLIKSNGNIEVAYGFAESNLSMVLLNVARENGYTHVTTLDSGCEDCSFFAGFAQPLRVASMQDLGDIAGIAWIYVQTKSGPLLCHVFCENDHVEAAREEWSKSKSVTTENLHIIVGH